MKKFIESKIAPSPKECIYWIDLNENPNGRIIKFYNGSKWENIGAEASSYVLPTSSASVLGGVKVGYTTSGKNYALNVDGSGNAYVNVPWTDTKVTVENVLTSTQTANALSAAQGKVLKDALDALTERVAALEAPAA